MQIASTKSRSARGASYQPALWMAAYYSHVYLVYLVDELVLVFLTPYNWANGGSVNFFCAW